MGVLAGVADDIVQRRFSTNWPRLAEDLTGIPSSPAAASGRGPSLADLMSQLEYVTSKVEGVERVLLHQSRLSQPEWPETHSENYRRLFDPGRPLTLGEVARARMLLNKLKEAREEEDSEEAPVKGDEEE